MSTTQIANIYNPLVFDAAVDEAAIEQNTLLQAGVLVPNPQLDDMASQGGNIGEMPFFTPLATTEPEYINDTSTDVGTPANIDSETMIWRLAKMHKSWSTMDIARELALADPMAAITAKIGGYWATQRQKRLVAAALGILADNVANDSSDMLHSVATDANSTVTAAEKISGETVIDACQTMGDAKEMLSIIAMHSVVYTTLQKQNLIDYIPNSEGIVNIPTYLGKTVLVDDSLPAVAGTYRITYTTLLLSQGAFEFGEGRLLLPSELERVPNAGYGGGQDIIHTRKADIIHPRGMSFISGSVAGKSPTLAELALAANWNRVMSRKNVGIAFLKTNG